MVSGPAFRSEIRRARSGDARHSLGRARQSATDDMPSYGQDEHTPLLLGRPDQSLKFELGVLKWPVRFFVTCLKVLRSGYANVLLIVLPFSLLSVLLKWPPMVQFVLSFIVIVPLSSLIEFATEELALRCGQTLSGIFVAIFGNTFDIVFGIVALAYNEIELLQATILGTILSSTLLSLGLSFMVGGLQFHEQLWRSPVVAMLSVYMAVLTMSLLLPTILHFIVSHFSQQQHHDMPNISRILAFVFLLIYIAYIFFQLCTHFELFDDEEVDIEEDHEEEATLSAWAAGVTLVISTILLVICTSSLISSISTTTETAHCSRAFIGFVGIPILSTTQPNLTAMIVAWKGKINLSVNLAIGSGLQIVLFVAPFLVLIGWAMGRALTFSFGILETVLSLFSSVVVLLVLQIGGSNYLTGILCVGMYIIIVTLIFVFGNEGIV